MDVEEFFTDEDETNILNRVHDRVGQLRRRRTRRAVAGSVLSAALVAGLVDLATSGSSPVRPRVAVRHQVKESPQAARIFHQLASSQGNDGVPTQPVPSPWVLPPAPVIPHSLIQKYPQWIPAIRGSLEVFEEVISPVLRPAVITSKDTFTLMKVPLSLGNGQSGSVPVFQGTFGYDGSGPWILNVDGITPSGAAYVDIQGGVETLDGQPAGNVYAPLPRGVVNGCPYATTTKNIEINMRSVAQPSTALYEVQTLKGIQASFTIGARDVPASCPPLPPGYGSASEKVNP